MADNKTQYGFRWASAWNGGKSCPVPIKMTVASGQDDQDDGSNSVDINIGDPLKLLGTGGVTLALTTDPISFICVGILPHWDAGQGVMRPNSKLPNQTTWGTVEARRSYVMCVPATAGLWEIDCDDSSTATTFAAYVALIHSNCNHVVAGNTANTSAKPEINITSAGATDEAFELRIMGISETAENKDFSGAQVKLIVAVNNSQLPGTPGTNVVGLA